MSAPTLPADAQFLLEELNAVLELKPKRTGSFLDQFGPMQRPALTIAIPSLMQAFISHTVISGKPQIYFVKGWQNPALLKQRRGFLVVETMSNRY